mmetsp:Transcript_24110/g.62111  ORF Transcript_24110/g.62111 Transcript_24110/m.62111 type:complete len:235 (+) Transcript_24110:1893-2597(+)
MLDETMEPPVEMPFSKFCVSVFGRVGYALCEPGALKKAIVQVGEKDTAKSFLVEHILKPLFAGLFYRSIKIHTMQESADMKRPDLLELNGVRLGVVEEPVPQGAAISASVLKKLSGGSEITARFLNSNDMQKFNFEGLLVFNMNEFVPFKDPTNATAERLDVFQLGTTIFYSPLDYRSPEHFRETRKYETSRYQVREAKPKLEMIKKYKSEAFMQAVFLTLLECYRTRVPYAKS